MNTVRVRNITLGEGLPKICIPFSEPDEAGLKKALSELENVPHDLVEWRADFYLTPAGTAGSPKSAGALAGDPQSAGTLADSPQSAGLLEDGPLNEALALLRRGLGDTPLLFTVRSKAEGGAFTSDTDEYVRLGLAAIESGLIDLADAELSRGPEAVKTIVKAAHARGVKVVGSRHDFTSTPDKEIIVGSLCRMQELGCDVAKFAVMPQSERDVLTLLDATLIMKEKHSGTPVITMSMGPLGAVSRVSGQLFGSCLTFGTAGKASAPGQLPAGRLQEFLTSLAI